MVFVATSSVYGVDISEDNVLASRDRLKVHLQESLCAFPRNALHPHEALLPALEKVLELNIILGDTLNDPTKINFTEWTFPDADFAKNNFKFRVQTRMFRLLDLLESSLSQTAKPNPLSVESVQHFHRVGA